MKRSHFFSQASGNETLVSGAISRQPKRPDSDSRMPICDGIETVLLLTDPLSIFGLVCIAAAITGGGLKALGAELPVIYSLVRQIYLMLFGLAIILIQNMSIIMTFIVNYNPSIIVNSGSLDRKNGRDIAIQCRPRGVISIKLNNLTPSRTDSGNNLGIYFRVCTPDKKECPWGQLSEGQSLKVKCEEEGQYDLNIFNFETNPPVNYTATITYPR